MCAIEKSNNKFQIDLELTADIMMSCHDSKDSLYYLDTLTGQPVIISTEIMNIVVKRDGAGTPVPGNFDPDSVLDAEGVLSDQKGRYVDLPAIDAITQFGWMDSFSEFVSNPNLYAKFKELFDVSEQIKTFYELLRNHPEEFGLWVHQLNSLKRQEAKEILAEFGIVEGPQFRFRKNECDA
jgi:hypothetical protein